MSKYMPADEIAGVVIHRPVVEVAANTSAVALGSLMRGVVSVNNAPIHVDTFTGSEAVGSIANLMLGDTANNIIIHTGIQAIVTVNLLNLSSYFVAPVMGAVPNTTINTAQYTGTILWTPVAATFQLGQSYTAQLSLTANPGYTFTGVAANAFYYSGAQSVTCLANSGNISVVFPPVADTNWQFDVNTKTLTWYNGAVSGVTSLNVPGIYNGYQVLHIDTSLRFYSGYLGTNLQQLILPTGLRSIGNSAFGGNPMLNNVTLPNTLLSIGDSALAMCGFTSLNIPDSVTSIGNYSFGGNASLTNIVFGNGLNTIPFNAFSGCSSLTTLNCPAAVTSIESSAFYDCPITCITLAAMTTNINVGYENGTVGIYTNQFESFIYQRGWTKAAIPAGTYLWNGSAWTIA